MSNQLQHRTEQLTGRLSRWNNFGARNDQLLAWMNKMSVDVKANNQQNIEDLLTYLQNVSAIENMQDGSYEWLMLLASQYLLLVLYNVQA